MRLLRVVVAGLVVALAGADAAGSPGTAVAEGVAVRPPLGWNSWNTYGCDIDEGKIRAAADAIVSTGMKAAGYRYVVVDDCWQATSRDAGGNLRPDPTRFPSGMRALGDYLHGKGLAFGIYQSPRERTCAQFAGVLGGATGARGHVRQDAETFAAWGVDYLKYDWCDPWGTIADQVAGFGAMRDALRATGRPIVFSINPNSAHTNTGPLYDWSTVADMWRTTEDIVDTWSTGCTADCFLGVSEILDVQAPLYPRAGPRHWNDPDMLEVGVRGTFTPDENRAHFSMWAMMAAPLIAGNDVTTMPADVRAVLTDPEVLAIDQDSAGRQARKVWDSGETEVWVRALSDGSTAMALLNRSDRAATVSATVAGPAHLVDVWTGAVRDTTGPVSATVAPHGVVLYRVTAR